MVVSGYADSFGVSAQFNIGLTHQIMPHSRVLADVK